MAHYILVVAPYPISDGIHCITVLLVPHGLIQLQLCVWPHMGKSMLYTGAESAGTTNYIHEWLDLHESV